MAAWAREHSEERLVLQGYLDVGELKAHQGGLAERRARAVRNALIAAGVRSDRIEVNAGTGIEPACLGRSATCRELNQRVVITPARGDSMQAVATPLRHAVAPASELAIR